MGIIENEILSIFSTSYETKTLKESFDRFECDVIIHDLIHAKEEEFNLFLQYNDRISITISINEEPYTFDSKSNNNTNNFWDPYNNYTFDIEDIVEIRILCQKNTSEGINIYDSVLFTEYVKSLSPLLFIKTVNNLLSNKERLILYSLDNTLDISTKNIKICSNSSLPSTIENPKENNRVDNINKLHQINQASFIENCITIPEDFKILAASKNPTQLNNQFHSSCLLLLFNLLFDISTIDGDNIFLKLNGYKTFSYNIPIKSIDINSIDTFYKIYQWVIQGGSLIDKIGLARNIISLNISKENPGILNTSCYDSILSGYKIYEKQNIKQYIELRNKISDQLFSFNEKANKVADDFANSFLKSALAMLSLFASIIITKIISNHNFKNLISVYEAIIVSVFTIGSFLYMIISNYDLKNQKIRFQTIYKNLKERNIDLLNEADINRILNNDKDYNDSIEYISTKVRNYNILWISLLLLILISTWLIALRFHPIETISNTPFRNL